MSKFQLASRLNQIEPFHVMEIGKMAAALEKKGKHMIRMGIGEPDFTAPPAVVEAAVRAMADGKMQYTCSTGILELRQAIAQHYQEVFGLDIPVSRIIVTAGASAALLFACLALVEQGTEVLMSDPSYPCYRHFVAIAEGQAKMIAGGPETRFQLSADLVRQHWSAATRGVLLATPSNPTGTSIEPAELARILDAVREKKGYAIVDEIYQELTYDSAPFSALSLGDDMIIINSFSKYFSMTGWRLGWMVVPETLIQPIEKLAQNLFICPSAIAQHAALACFTPESISIYEERKACMKRRRDYIVPALKSLGFKVPVIPDGAFYVYADCSDLSSDAYQLVLDMLNQTGVVLIPGLDFGPATANQYIRLSYATSEENLREAIARLKQFFDQREKAVALA